MQKPLHCYLVKAMRAECDQFQYGREWLVARRGLLKVFEDHLQCGDWRIPYSEISEAVLQTTRTCFFLPVRLLKIQTPDEIYHFRFTEAFFRKPHLPFAVKNATPQRAEPPAAKSKAP
jgi:hypothetical protein